MGKLKQNLTLRDFTLIVSFDEIEYVLGKRRYAKFCKWMDGQTMSRHGVYADDLKRFLEGLPVID